MTFIVSYEDVDLTDIDESTLDVYKYVTGTWVAQNCTLDTTEKTLTCTLPSFSVYGVFGSGIGGTEPEPTPTPTPSSSKSSDKKESSSCKADHVMSAPDLFQIDMGASTATVFFTPLLQTNQYYISYSTNSNAEEHGALVTLSSDGVQNFTIKELQPHQTYYFKVRGHKDCTPGPWSNSRSGLSESVYSEEPSASMNQTSQIDPENENVDSKEMSELNSLNESEEITTSNEVSATGGLYDVYVVVKSEGQTVASATVELPELNMQATTNEEGVAVFKDVKKGSHVFKLVKDAYAAEETITVEGDEKDFDVSITLQVQENFFSSQWPWLLIVLLLLLIIIWLYKSKTKK